MDFENDSAEEAYTTIVNSQGLGLYELVSRPEDYRQAMDENESLRPQDLDRNDKALRAFQILEEAGLLMEDGSFNTYEVVSDPDVYGEALEKLDEKRDHLV